jgi:hypothetical protein
LISEDTEELKARTVGKRYQFNYYNILISDQVVFQQGLEDVSATNIRKP